MADVQDCRSPEHRTHQSFLLPRLRPLLQSIHCLPHLRCPPNRMHRHTLVAD